MRPRRRRRLLAYGARVELNGASGRQRAVPLSTFLLPPDAKRAHDADDRARRDPHARHRSLHPAATRSAYHKQTERDSYDWPICDVAVVLRLDAEVVREASIVLGWVAPTPRHATAAEAVLRGAQLTEDVGSTRGSCCCGRRDAASEERVQGADSRSCRPPERFWPRRRRDHWRGRGCQAGPARLSDDPVKGCGRPVR